MKKKKRGKEEEEGWLEFKKLELDQERWSELRQLLVRVSGDIYWSLIN